MRNDEKKTNLNRFGWKIWRFQNILVLLQVFTLLAYFLIIPSMSIPIMIQVDLLTFQEILVNLLFFSIISLDLLAVGLILLGEIIEIKERKPKVVLIAVVSGLCWILLSLFWRASLILASPLFYGIRRKYLFSFPVLIAINPLLVGMIFSSSILLVIFLGSQDTLIHPKLMPFSNQKNCTYDLGTLFGLVNFISTLPIVLFGIDVFLSENPLARAYGYYNGVGLFLLMISFFMKGIITPFIGMTTAAKYILCIKPESVLQQPSIQSMKSKEGGLTQSFANFSSLRSSFTRRSISMESVGILLVIILPAAVVNFDQNMLTIQPLVEGPFISRTYTSEEEGQILRYLEAYPLSNTSGCLGDFYPMTNTTLEYYLDTIQKKISIQGTASWPSSYYFRWNATVAKSPFPSLNASNIQLFWHWPGNVPCIIWWTNNSQYNVNSLKLFLNVSLQISWVYWVEYEYNESDIFVDAGQLMFLDESWEVVCVMGFKMTSTY